MLEEHLSHNLKKLLYISTNQINGGSEMLWSHSASEFKKNGYQIKVATYYSINKLAVPFSLTDTFNLNTRFRRKNIFQRIFQKLTNRNNQPQDKLERLIKAFKPSLVLISQGNNLDGFDLMSLCTKLNVPYVTITQLVTEVLWLSLNDDKIKTLQELYGKAIANFFVSKHNLELHEKMIGVKHHQSKIIFNPFTKSKLVGPKYPNLNHGYYQIALVGRLETYHKGYDLLIEVISQEKWKSRNLKFTIYGSGPHKQLLRRLIALYNIQNIELIPHVDIIAEIWEKHHLLMMPSRMEGQSLSLIEAMNYKRAAVVTLVGGVEELIEDGNNGFIAKHPTVDSIDLALENAWQQRYNWEEMGINAYNSIKKQHPEDAVNYFNEQIIKFLI